MNATEAKLSPADGTPAHATLLDAVPPRERERIVSGMRWTIWATIATAPLAYCVNTLLARMGPDVIGVYGLTTIYSFFASTFFFFGGGAVVIKFAPSLPEEKLPGFLASYLLVILAFALPWEVAGTLKPSLLYYVFGNSGSQSLQILLLWIAPLYAVYLLVDSALAALLELRYQQLIRRLVSVAAFAAYTLAFFLARDFLARHYAVLIWGVYLGLTLIAAVLGAQKIMTVCRGRLRRLRLSTRFPPGFWRYSVGVQANSLLGICAGLAGVFTLNAGGLAAFGRFAALMAIVTLIDRSVLLILGSFLPSLTTAMELPDPQAAPAIIATWSRLLLLGILVVCVTFSAAAVPLIGLFGNGYGELIPLVPLACAGAAIDALNQLTASIYYAVGRPYANAGAQLARFLVLVVCFWPLWAHYHLLGAVLAWFMSELVQCVAQIAMLIVSRNQFRAALSRTVTPYLLTLAALLIISRSSSSWGAGERSLAYAACIPVFFYGARFSVRELTGMVRLVLPLTKASG